MSLNNDKSDIAESFRNLLKKADEMALEKKKDDLIDKKKPFINQRKILNDNIRILSTDRLGIKDIKRIPENPFKISNKKKNQEYLQKRKELVIKLSIILNKHIHYWLQRELPKFTKIKLRKKIYSLLTNIQK